MILKHFKRMFEKWKNIEKVIQILDKSENNKKNDVHSHNRKTKKYHRALGQFQITDVTWNFCNFSFIVHSFNKILRSLSGGIQKLISF